MSYGWQGVKVRLVPLDRAAHLENALRWFNDPEITERTLVGDLPIGRLAEEAFFEQALRTDPAGTPTEITFAVETLNGEHVGLTGFYRIEWRHGAATSGIVIGSRERWGQGLASDAISVRTRYAFEALGLRLLLAEAMADNPASLRMLVSAGYREVGRIPGRYFKRGAYRDAVLFALHRDDRARAS
ncbi:MAG: GNAT family N-acetyltransferase [Acidobacteriota bacterium]